MVRRWTAAGPGAGSAGLEAGLALGACQAPPHHAAAAALGIRATDGPVPGACPGPVARAVAESQRVGLFDSMEYTTAPESPSLANAWLDSHQRKFGFFVSPRPPAACLLPSPRRTKCGSAWLLCRLTMSGSIPKGARQHRAYSQARRTLLPRVCKRKLGTWTPP